jgi:hypothetical protein
MDHLAELLRGIHAQLKAAPADAHRRAQAHMAELGPVWAIVGPQPFALGTLEACIEHVAARLDATIHVHLERKRRRRR